MKNVYLLELAEKARYLRYMTSNLNKIANSTLFPILEPSTGRDIIAVLHSTMEEYDELQKSIAGEFDNHLTFESLVAFLDKTDHPLPNTKNLAFIRKVSSYLVNAHKRSVAPLHRKFSATNQ